MNGGQTRIEIFQPFGDAFEWMKRMLFRPFDLKKWLVLGFAAFIAGNWGGFGVGNFNPDAFKNTRADNVRPHFHMADLGPWGMVALVVAVILWSFWHSF